MSEYRRLISYIYEYEGKEKGKNVGFVKLESRNGQCRLNLNIKRIYASGNATGVYLLGKDRQKTFLGNIFIRNGNGEFRIIMDSQNVSGSGNGLDTYYGLTVHDVKNSWRSYTTIWEDAILPEEESDTNTIGTMAEEVLPDSTQVAPQSPELLNVAREIEEEIAQEEIPVAHAAEVGACDECQQEDKQPEMSVEESQTEESLTEEVLVEETCSSESDESETLPSEPPESESSVPEPEPKPEAKPAPKPLAQKPKPPTHEKPAPKPPAPEPDVAPEPQHAPMSETFPPLELEDPDILKYLQETEDLATDPEKLWQELRKSYPKMQSFDYDGECEILAIRPQDIGRLPRESWIYGNNSFLLHGYYSFRYLILVRLCGESDRPRYLIGVPGHYYSNEKYMASMFGFPNFVLSKKQPPNDGRFGYWYTDIRIR